MHGCTNESGVLVLKEHVAGWSLTRRHMGKRMTILEAMNMLAGASQNQATTGPGWTESSLSGREFGMKYCYTCSASGVNRGNKLDR